MTATRTTKGVALRRLSMPRVFRGQTAGLIALIVLLVLVLLAVLAPVISPHNPIAVSPDTLQGPSWTHPFGTDQLGRDVLSRVFWGGRVTLLAAVVGVAIAAAIGLPLGMIAGYSSRWVSSLIMRVMDVLLAFPGLLLALVIVAILGTGMKNIIVAIGVAFIPIFARLVYGSTLAAKEHDYVAAARLSGCRSPRIIMRHILPNIAGEIVIVTSSALGWAILTATTLNFLGFGVKPPTAEWGADLAAGQDYLYNAWWTSTFPGLAITIAILSVNYVGDWLAGLFEPRARRSVDAPTEGAEIPEGIESLDTLRVGV